MFWSRPADHAQWFGVYSIVPMGSCSVSILFFPAPLPLPPLELVGGVASEIVGHIECAMYIHTGYVYAQAFVHKGEV